VTRKEKEETMPSRQSYVAWFAIIGALVATPTMAFAQGCGKCSDETEGPDSHVFGEEGATFSCLGNENPQFGCHDEFTVYGVCSQIHDDCGSDDDAEMIALSVEAGDVSQVTTLLFRAGAQASVGPRTEYVDVRCGDLLIARIRVPSEMRADLGERVAAVRNSFLATRLAL
jgi:hypothetical protein